MTRLAAVMRWCGGGGGWRERRARQRLLRRRRQHCGGTVLLGRPRRGGWSRLAVSRLVRWRLMAELLRPIRKALADMAAVAAATGPRQLVAPLPLLNFPFVGALSLPAVVA